MDKILMSQINDQIKIPFIKFQVCLSLITTFRLFQNKQLNFQFKTLLVLYQIKLTFFYISNQTNYILISTFNRWNRYDNILLKLKQNSFINYYFHINYLRIYRKKIQKNRLNKVENYNFKKLKRAPQSIWSLVPHAKISAT